VQKRLGAFYLLSVIAAGFGSILGYVIAKLDGYRGIRGWSWIFVSGGVRVNFLCSSEHLNKMQIIEGSITVTLGVISLLLLPDFPHQNKWLTPEETRIVLDRIQADRGDAKPDRMTFRVFCRHAKDWTIWATGSVPLPYQFIRGGLTTAPCRAYVHVCYNASERGWVQIPAHSTFLARLTLNQVFHDDHTCWDGMGYSPIAPIDNAPVYICGESRSFASLFC
jgi:hypothetical protein